MSYSEFVASVTLLVISVCPFSTATADPPGSAAAWRLVFNDEFDGNALDQTKWNYHYPWSRVHNHEAYSRSRNVSVSDGKLILTALEESFGGKPYTTGVVNTNGKFHLTYGYIEARLKMPSTKGSWPAFWMLRSGWPPEIDIMEFPLSDLSQDHNEKYRYWWNYHWGTVSDHRSAGSEEWVSSDLSRGFHTYAVDWSPDYLRFYFDGALRGEVTNRGAIAESWNMYMILNFAVGGWPGSPPSWPEGGDTYEIDWVRVWQPGQAEEPDEFIDLGDIVGGGSGDPTTSPPFVGIHPATGDFSDDLGLDRVTPSGPNPQPVEAAWIDSVFLMLDDLSVVNTRGTRFRFPAGDSSGSTWDLIANAVEPDGPRGALWLGPKGLFTRGIGIHAASGITFDLEALRTRHGDGRVAFFSAFAGEGSVQANGSVNNHVILADHDGNVVFSESTGLHRDDGRFIEIELPRSARFLTLASGSAGDGNGQDHGVFCNAFITPCSVSDPDLCQPPVDEVMVFSGSSWTYLDEGPAPPIDWIERVFSTAGWKSGRAQLGYGEGDETTEISFGTDPNRKRITTYFRRLFTARQVNEISGLSLWLLRDDGAIVYLNGVELLRSNLPADPVGSETLASVTIGGGDEDRWVVKDVDPCLLVEGTNILAVEVHQATGTSSDVSFDLVLAADRNPDASNRCREDFVRGDCNGDGDTRGVTDAVFLLGYTFLGTAPPPCPAACDVNGDGDISGVTDAVYQLAFNFLGGPSPRPPFPDCGTESLPSEVALGCETPPSHCDQRRH